MGITLNDFAKKYDIPYIIVYNAHFLCPCYNPYYRRKNAEYDEHELFEAVHQEIRQSLKRFRDRADQQAQYLANLEGFK